MIPILRGPTQQRTRGAGNLRDLQSGSLTMGNKQCKLCGSWDPFLSGHGVGRCRLNPPTPNKQPSRITTGEWPTTYDIDWCDKFTEKKGVGNG
jgi:hypothetical protein